MPTDRNSITIDRTGTAPKRKSVAGYSALNSPITYITLLLVSLSFAYIIANYGFAWGMLITVVLIGLPVVYTVIAFPKYGIIVLMVAAYFIMYVIKVGINFPLGTLMDALEVLLFLGFLLKQKSTKDWRMLRNPVSIIIIIWVTYNIAQVANPSAESRLAWLYTIRPIALTTFMYFVFMYNIDSVKFIKLIIYLWLLLGVAAAIYAFKQEYIGFTNFEKESLSDPLTAQLFFIDGHWRKFSFFSDPVAFAYNMVIDIMLCLALMWGPTSVRQKILLSFLIILFLSAMLFSGTRGAYVLIPSGLALFFVMTFTKKLIPFAVIALMILIVAIKIPSGNPTLVRFQSAFKPSNDASFNVRQENQRRVKPYILKHPLGGGLGATGAWGVRFAPYSFLASFPPDSGYMRVAAEIGWIGLILFCVMMFIILRAGILNFYRIKDPELKCYCLAMVLMVFVLNIGNYPQEALAQYPTNIYIYIIIAIINVTMKLDLDKQKAPEIKRTFRTAV